jgi:hypothetical protein
MPYISVNPDPSNEPYNRRLLAATIHGKLSSDLTSTELAEAYNLVEDMGCELPPPDVSVTILADGHDRRVWGG